jgi:NADPH-ferrihemoprotein reductase
MEKIFPALKKELSSKTEEKPVSRPKIGPSGTHPRLAEMKFQVEEGDQVDCSLMEDDSILAKISNARFLTTTEATKTVVQVTLESENFPSHLPGDAIYIRCPNHVDDVLFVQRRLALSEQKVIRCKDSDVEFWPHHVPKAVDCFSALSWYVDLGALPSKRLLRALAEHCADDKDKQSLMDYCALSAEGKAKYAELAAVNCGLVMLLTMHPSCTPPIALLFNLMSVLKPRSYSICSYKQADPQHIDVVFSVVKAGEFRGVCTNWLATLATHPFLADRQTLTDEKKALLVKQIEHWARVAELVVPIRFHPPTHFRLVKENVKSAPIIMVGPGTGVAPFMGFCSLIANARKEDGAILPENHLFFGCRNRKADYLFQSELEGYQETNVLKSLHVAASREDPNKVVYVQHLIEEQGDMVFDVLMNRTGFLYVCGDARNMAPDVQKALVRVLEKNNMTTVEAEEAVKKMKEEHRYLVDVWA